MDSDIEEKIKYVPNKNDINLTDDLCSESSSNSKIFNKDIYIYSWGKNKFGELGLNNAKNTFIPSPVKTLKSIVINSVKSGGRNTILLTSDGQVLMCGSNIFNLLAIDDKFQNNEQYQKTFKPIKFFEEKLLDENNEIIKEIAIAEFHSLALSNKGEIYGWGGNLYNKLGQTNGLCGLPSKIYIKKKIVSIACGDYHSCALSENGVLYTWGGGGESYNKGQCGHGSKKDIDNPKKVEFFTKKGLHVIKIACGGYHTIAMDENNQLYGFGKGIFGQCGYGANEDVDIPRKINFNDNNKIIDIKCGGEHTIFLSNNGRVYACGHGYYGQLGLGNNKNIKSPILVQSLSNKRVIEIDAGWSHSLVLTDEGNVYCAGCGKFGELGLGENKNKYNYTWIRKLGYMNVRHIFAGGHHSWCLIDDKYPLKERFVEPEPLEKPNYIMTKRKSSNLSDNNLSFNETNNRRQKTSNTVDYGKNRRNPYNEHNSMRNLNNRINSFDNNEDRINNINILNNKDLKRMIDDYNEEDNNNIDNLIDCFDKINSSPNYKKNKNNINNYNNLNNENEEDNYIRRNQNDDGNEKNNKNKISNFNDNYNSRKDPFINDQNNLSDNSFENKINSIANDDNMMNNLNNKGNKNQNYINKNNNVGYINNKNDYINNNNNNDEDYNDIDYEDFNEDNYIRNKININNSDINKNSINNKKKIELNPNDNYNKNKNFNKQKGYNNNRNNDEMNNINEYDNIYNNKTNPINNKNDNYSQKQNSNSYDPYNKNINDNYSKGKNNNYGNNMNNNYNYNNSSKNNIQKDNNYSKKNNEVLLHLNNIKQNRIQLQVIYSELNLSHRFIRFSISKTNKYYQLDFKSMNNMIAKYLSFDKGNVNFKLQDDREVLKEGKKAINPMMENLLKEMKESGLFNSENINKISYTIAIVYDYNRNSMLRQLYEDYKENYSEKNISYINFKIINENQIINNQDELEGVLSKWTIDFFEQFKELFIYFEDGTNIDNLGNNIEKINKPRFLEMRPKIFK